MDKKRIFGKLLKAPLVLLGLAGAPASAYAAYNNIGGITYATTVLFVFIAIAYFAGFYLDRSGWLQDKIKAVRKKGEESTEETEED